MIASLIGFLVVFLGLWGGMNYYAYVNLAAAGLDRAVLIPLMWVLALTFPVMRFLTLRWRHPLMRILYWTGAVWMGAVFLLAFWFLLSSLARRLFHSAGLSFAADKGPWMLATAVLVAFMVVWGMLRAMRGPKEVRYAIDHGKRYGAGKTARVVQISDVHLGLTLGLDFLSSLVERINALKPDLILITGDLLDHEFPHDDEAAALLAQLRAAQGVYSVSGNHEFYAGLDRFLAIMEKAGIPVLDNEMRTTPEGIQVTGIHDPTAKRFAKHGVDSNLEKALRDIRHDKPSILLAHQPKDLDLAIDRKIDMIFSGHTHAGQIFPFHLMVRLSFRYLGGRYTLGPDTDLIVCTGTGFWGPPLRLGTDSQIVVADFRY